MELDGIDAFPWIGDADAVLDEIQEFMTGERRTSDPGRALATVLFTDIVDSTRRAAELGDAEWLAILERHDARVREELAAHDGVEVDTAGDGFFATFDGPARAVRCARTIGERIRELGLEVRAGVHTGEVERAGKQVRGIAVHIGARVGAVAGANEVLVTSHGQGPHIWLRAHLRRRRRARTEGRPRDMASLPGVGRRPLNDRSTGGAARERQCLGWPARTAGVELNSRSGVS